MKSLTFFNNKGGVGKTTLACNVAAHLSKNLKYRVLLVDCDPQCNSTQLILSPEDCEDLYWKSKRTSKTTLLDVMKPIQDGDSHINEAIVPFKSDDNRFVIDVLPGHPRMSIVEDRLSQAWSEAIGGDIGGMRKTNWCVALCNQLEKTYDITIFDVGPSLGSLNRSVLIGSEFFVTPMGCDIFSIVGIRNIASWLREWIDFYNEGMKILKRRNAEALQRFTVSENIQIVRGFAGYTVQQYITKAKQGVRRPTLAFENILKSIPGEIENSLGDFVAADVDMESAKLGDVPNMFSLIPLAQSANAPIIGLRGQDGLVGTQFSQSESYAKLIDHVARTIVKNMGME